MDVLLSSKNKLEKAKQVLKNMYELPLDPSRDFIFHNIRISLSDRLNDHEIIDKRIEGINKIIHAAGERERKRLIEVLGIFTAILSFIFVNVNIALKSLAVQDTLTLMGGMALILVLFAIVMSLLFARKRDSLVQELRFWIIVTLVLCFFVLYRLS